MFCRSLIFSVRYARNMSENSQFRYKSSGVMAVNTYYRFKKKDVFGIQPQKFKYFLVLDFEATCDNKHFPEMEIIEFPCLKVCGKSFHILDQYHEYVRPSRHPILTPFCTNLTGIDQTHVNDKAQFSEVLESFLSWLCRDEPKFCGTDADSVFVTSGEWDLRTMLPNQCKLLNLPVPSVMTSWINIKTAYLKSTGVYPRGIVDMLKRLNLQHEGRLHSGIDDCRNIVKVMQGLAQRGYVFETTSRSSEAGRPLTAHPA